MATAIAPADALAVFERQERPGAPLTAPEVAEALGCARRTAYEKLATLAERGDLATKKVGARGRVWWRPAHHRTGATASGGAPRTGEAAVAAAGPHFEAVFTDSDALRALLAPDGTLRHANEAAYERIDADPASIEGTPFSETPWWTDSADLQADVAAWVDRAAGGETVRFETARGDADGVPMLLAGSVRPVTDAAGEVVALVVEARRLTDRTSHRRALRELHDASRRLMRAETREDVCEVAVDAARRILGLPLNGLWLHDPEEEALEPVAWTQEGLEEFGEPPAFPVEESLAGRAFREGTYRAYDDITTEDGVYDRGTRVRSELVLPLGDRGVLNASSLEVGAFDEVDVSLGRVLAANVETALERAERLEERRARRRELERQRDELERLNQINALVEDTIGSLVDAATREEIEHTVCERLADSGFYVDAWTAERGSSPGSAVLRTGAGDDAVASFAGSDGAVPGPNPVTTALEERALQVVPRLAADECVPEELRGVALASGARSCLVAPLSYADTVFGALVVHAPAEDAFSGRERAAFETLGRVVGFVINATNNRQLLLGNTAVELEVALRGTDAWFPSAAERLGGTVSVEGLVPTGDDTLLEYVTAEGGGEDAVVDVLADQPAVADTRVLAADGDRWFLECTVRRDGAGLWSVAEYGASVRTARAADGTGTVTARFPASASPREAMAVVREAFPTAELVAKRVVDVSDRSVASVRQAVADRLTDKQLAALRAAFLAGYYDSPRGTTAQDLAASLDIAPSTLHQHLQAASRKLLATVFDDLSA